MGLLAGMAANRMAPQAAPYIAELEQLSQLRDQGVISSEEFEAKKKQLLGR